MRKFPHKNRLSRYSGGDKMQLSQKIQQFIDSSLGAADFYEILSKKAPNSELGLMLAEIAKDERDNASAFNMVFKMFTGRPYVPQVEKIETSGDFRKLLRSRLLTEAARAISYGEEFLITERNKPLKSAYQKAMQDAYLHGQQIAYILDSL